MVVEVTCAFHHGRAAGHRSRGQGRADEDVPAEPEPEEQDDDPGRPGREWMVVVDLGVVTARRRGAQRVAAKKPQWAHSQKGYRSVPVQRSGWRQRGQSGGSSPSKSMRGTVSRERMRRL
jgi:hypothetical protein